MVVTPLVDVSPTMGFGPLASFVYFLGALFAATFHNIIPELYLEELNTITTCMLCSNKRKFTNSGLYT
jgi:hypothetical protein